MAIIYKGWLWLAKSEKVQLQSSEVLIKYLLCVRCHWVYIKTLYPYFHKLNQGTM